jgi:hypothetical protein
MAFVKLDCGILDSSLWSEDLSVRVVFLTMLAMSDANGLVAATAPGIAARARLSLDDTRAALDVLSSPDQDSRSLADEGRRIRRVDGGFFLVNYEQYRARDYTAAARKQRQRQRDVTRDIVTVTRDIVTVTQAEAEAEAEEENNNERTAALTKTNGTERTATNERTNGPTLGQREEMIFDTYRKIHSKTDRYALDAKRSRALRARIKEGRTDAEFTRAFRGCLESGFHVDAGHTDLELICRDAPHFDRFLALADESAPAPVRDVLRGPDGAPLDRSGA